MSKRYLLDLVRKHRKSGVVFLSGDVHFAQFYHTRCQSLTGYNLPELTTSGLTHHVKTFFPFADRLLSIATPRFWTDSEIYIDFNFGLITVEKTGSDATVTLQVRHLDNGVKLEKRLSLTRDLRFNDRKLRYPRMCEAIHYKGEKILQLNRYIEVFVTYRDGYGVGLVAVLASLFSLVVSASAKTLRKLGKLLQLS